MAKPKRERLTTNPFGLRLNHILKTKNMVGDYATLANLFGVKVPSVYGWVDTGRIHKDKLARLVEWSGQPYAWWLDASPIATEPPAEAQPTLTAHSDRAVYDLDQAAKRPRLDITTVLIALGHQMNALDPPLRTSIGALINGMCVDPQTTGKTINRIAALLATEGKTEAPKSINSQAA